VNDTARYAKIAVSADGRGMMSRPLALQETRKARAAARERAWALAGDRAPGAGGGLIPLDIDVTIVTTHSEKGKAAPTWKNTFGFHHWPRSPIMAAGQLASRWTSCGGPVTPGQIPRASILR
jgi:hypothetical protein